MPGSDAKIWARGGSGLRECIDELLQAAHDSGIAWRGLKRFLGEIAERFGVKTCRKPLQPQGRELPIAIAARAPEQIDLTRDAFKEGPAQLGKQLRIVARRRCECRVQSSGFVGHAGAIGIEG